MKICRFDDEMNEATAFAIKQTLRVTAFAGQFFFFFLFAKDAITAACC
jgi:hypothetical protein